MKYNICIKSGVTNGLEKVLCTSHPVSVAKGNGTAVPVRRKRKKIMKCTRARQSHRDFHKSITCDVFAPISFWEEFVYLQHRCMSTHSVFSYPSIVVGSKVIAIFHSLVSFHWRTTLINGIASPFAKCCHRNCNT